MAELKDNAYLVLAFLALMWLVLLLGVLCAVGRHRGASCRARSPGLRGIIFAPFIHANIFHLVANTIPFALLGYLVTMYGQGTFFACSPS